MTAETKGGILSGIRPGTQLKTVEGYLVDVLFTAPTYDTRGVCRLVVYGSFAGSLRSWDQETGRLIKISEQDFDGLHINPSSLQARDNQPIQQLEITSVQK